MMGQPGPGNDYGEEDNQEKEDGDGDEDDDDDDKAMYQVSFFILVSRFSFVNFHLRREYNCVTMTQPCQNNSTMPTNATNITTNCSREPPG